jgi:hypothetical protein
MNAIRLGPRAQAALVIVLVAASGVFAGVLVERLVAQQRAPAEAPLRVPSGMMERGPLGPGAAMRPGQRGQERPRGALRAAAEARYAERLAVMLDLSADQQRTVDSIMTEQRRHVQALTAEVEPRFRAIAEETRERVEAVLSPEQLEQMRSMRQRRLRW